MTTESMGSRTEATARTRWALVAALALGLAGVGMGFLATSKGTMEQGGVACGSVWLVKAYHSGCESWLDDMARVVFLALGASTTLLLFLLVSGRGGVRVLRGLPVAAGIAIAVLGPRLWHDAVFVDFGY